MRRGTRFVSAAITVVFLVISPALFAADASKVLLRDRLLSASIDYADSAPGAASWLKILATTIYQNAPRNEIIKAYEVKRFVIENACGSMEDTNCPERAGTWASALHAKVSGMDAEITSEELVIWLKHIGDVILPPPPEPVKLSPEALNNV